MEIDGQAEPARHPGQLIAGLYAPVDSIFVGQMVGVEAKSAVSVASPFVLFNNGVAVLIGTGSGSVLSRAIGAKDQRTSGIFYRLDALAHQVENVATPQTQIHIFSLKAASIFLSISAIA